MLIVGSVIGATADRAAAGGNGMSVAPAETASRGPGVVASVRRLQAHYPVAQIVALVVLFTYGAATLDGFALAAEHLLDARSRGAARHRDARGRRCAS